MFLVLLSDSECECNEISEYERKELSNLALFLFSQVTEYRGNVTPEDLSDENMEGGPIHMTPKPFKMEVIDC